MQRLLEDYRWRLAVESAELASGGFLVASGAVGFTRFLWEHVPQMWLRGALITLLAIIFFAASVRLKKEYKQFSGRVRKQKTEGALRRQTEIASRSSDPDTIVPKEAFVRQTFDYIKDEVDAWADDAELGSENFYVDVVDGEVSYTFQAYYHSDAKGLTRTLYMRSGTGASFDNYEEKSKYAEHGSSPQAGILDRKWRTATVKALDSVLESLPSKYKVAIQQISFTNQLHIGIEFQQGRVKRNIRFTLDDKKLLRWSGDQEKPIAWIE